MAPGTWPRRSILFALSFFHATLLERKKFGVGNQPGARSGIGWNMGYPFNLGDLLCCGQLAANYLDNSSRVSSLCCHAVLAGHQGFMTFRPARRP